MNEYGSMAVQKLCKGNRRSRDLTPNQHWLSNRASTDVSFSKAVLVLLLNTVFSFSAILNVRMILAVPLPGIKYLIRQQYFV